LIKIAELARLELWRERRRDIDVALQLDFEFRDIGWPALDLARLRPQPRARTEIVIGPHVYHAVERADFGVPEGGERRDLRPGRQGLGKALFKSGDRARLQRVATHLDNHTVSSVSRVNQATLDPDGRVSSTPCPAPRRRRSSHMLSESKPGNSGHF